MKNDSFKNMLSELSVAVSEPGLFVYSYLRFAKFLLIYDKLFSFLFFENCTRLADSKLLSSSILAKIDKLSCQSERNNCVLKKYFNGLSGLKIDLLANVWMTVLPKPPLNFSSISFLERSRYSQTDEILRQLEKLQSLDSSVLVSIDKYHQILKSFQIRYQQNVVFLFELKDKRDVLFKDWFTLRKLHFIRYNYMMTLFLLDQEIFILLNDLLHLQTTLCSIEEQIMLSKIRVDDKFNSFNKIEKFTKQKLNFEGTN